MSFLFKTILSEGADKNKDERISFEEFVEALQKADVSKMFYRNSIFYQWHSVTKGEQEKNK